MLQFSFSFSQKFYKIASTYLHNVFKFVKGTFYNCKFIHSSFVKKIFWKFTYLNYSFQPEFSFEQQNLFFHCEESAVRLVTFNSFTKITLKGWSVEVEVAVFIFTSVWYFRWSQCCYFCHSTQSERKLFLYSFVQLFLQLLNFPFLKIESSISHESHILTFFPFSYDYFCQDCHLCHHILLNWKLNLTLGFTNLRRHC